MSQGPPPRPSAETRPPRRLSAVDALRAIALLGILAVNIRFFADPVLLSGAEPTTPATTADQLVALTVTVVFEAKSYVLFSFLFGLSFVHQQAAARRVGASESGRTLRRMLVLAVLGVLHGILLFAGDILLTYAILGTVLLALRGLSTRAATGLAVVVVASGFSLAILGLGALAVLASGTPGFADALPEAPDAAAAVAAYTGSVPEYLAFQLEQWAALAPSILFGQGIMAFAAFLAGLAAARGRVIERIVDGAVAPAAERAIPTARLVGILVPCMLVGLTLSTTAAVLSHGLPGAPTTPAPPEALLVDGMLLVAGPIQTIGATLLVLLVLRSRPGTRLTAALSPAGRMTLTNYLGQSLVLALVFSGLGAGLAGEVSGVVVGALVVLIWGLQLIVSALWMRRFRRGPLEVPLRAITYADRRR